MQQVLVKVSAEELITDARYNGTSCEVNAVTLALIEEFEALQILKYLKASDPTTKNTFSLIINNGEEFTVEYQMFKEKTDIESCKKIFGLTETQNYNNSTVDLIDLLKFEMKRGYYSSLNDTLEDICDINAKTYQKFHPLHQYCTDFDQNNYIHIINTIENFFALERLADLKFSKNYDLSINSIIEQYLGKNNYIEVQNKNNEPAKLYPGPIFEDGFTQLHKNQLILFFDQEVISNLMKTDSYNELGYRGHNTNLYLKNKELPKYKLHLDSLNKKQYIEISNNYIGDIRFSTKKNMFSFSVTGIYDGDQIKALTSEDIKKCKAFDYRVNNRTFLDIKIGRKKAH